MPSESSSRGATSTHASTSRVKLMPAVRARLREVGGLDLRSLALFRAALASLLLADLIGRFPYLEVCCTDLGVLPVEQNALPSLHALSGSYAFQVLLFLVAGLFAVMCSSALRPACRPSRRGSSCCPS